MFLLAILAAGAYSILATPQYHSKARLFISTDVSSQENAYAAAIFSQQRVTSYADLAKSGQVLSEVIRKLNLDLTTTELASKISASVPVNTVIIDIEAKDPSARTAQQIAQAEAESLATYIGTVETPTGDGEILFKVAEVFEPAGADASSVPDDMQKQFTSGLSDDMLDGLVAQLQTQYSVSIDQTAVSQAMQ